MRVRVYRNLNKRCWSVKCFEPGHASYNKVIHHAQSVELEGVTFIVSEAGRQRAIREGRRNVHAYAQGTLVNVNTIGMKTDEQKRLITYQPFHHPHFREITGMLGTPLQDVFSAKRIFFSKAMRAWAV